MINNGCVCPRCIHPTCPNPNAEPPHDEVTHEVGNTILSVKIPKSTRQFQSDDPRQLEQKLSFDFNCADAEGVKCKPGCTKVHVIPDQQAPPKEPDEETLSLKAVRQILPNQDLKNTLEIEFKAPRNYIPLPELGPSPPIIVPKQTAGSRRKRRCKLEVKRKK
ncbi:uncharacterized protein LOC128887719 [Hylaeus anthracinus]|uniref:uncharacterized protein LOC128887719 n=1 Tax=Hylaeus anthracinus TaxID=313031 RepID=UPI0023B98C78|nr:uncharacterized protein LOC128887719 [Hylaeus anthracinus]